MTQGLISKIVNTFGSHWGTIRPRGESRDVFFNKASLDDPDLFESLAVGREVEFEEHADNVNRSHAEHLRVATASPA